MKNHTKGKIEAKIFKNKTCEPWRIYSGTKIICKMESYDRFNKDANEEEKANAQRIAKCWNMHDEMLAELKEYNKEFNCWHATERLSDEGKNHHEYLKELIKQAEL